MSKVFILLGWVRKERMKAPKSGWLQYCQAVRGLYLTDDTRSDLQSAQEFIPGTEPLE